MRSLFFFLPYINMKRSAWVLGAKLGKQLRATLPLTLPCHRTSEEKSTSGKQETCLDKNCLIKEKWKKTETKQNKPITHHLPRVDRCPASSKANAGLTLLNPPPLHFITDTIWHGISLWIVQVICLVVYPPNILCIPSHSGGDADRTQ